ncbi:MAG TPA: hypothetical protein VFM90_05215, partial [Cyclobacteriaceae bacterium]|nr:hypothetical protein [Cyclobacteriaceae bacterium]
MKYIFIFLLACCIVSYGFAQQGDLSVDTLKQMSLEELMSLEVISVSKRSEKLSAAASAIQVI